MALLCKITVNKATFAKLSATKKPDESCLRQAAEQHTLARRDKYVKQHLPAQVKGR